MFAPVSDSVEMITFVNIFDVPRHSKWLINSQVGIQLVSDQYIPHYLQWRYSRLAGLQVAAGMGCRWRDCLGKTSSLIQNPIKRILLRPSLQP